MNSSACEDIDALDPLVRLAIRDPSFYPQVLPVVAKGIRWVLYNFNPDGGASFRQDSSFHYGHDLMFSAVNESSIFPAWFRTLTVALCCELLKDSFNELSTLEFNYLDCPGLQYSPYHKLTNSERK